MAVPLPPRSTLTTRLKWLMLMVLIALLVVAAWTGPLDSTAGQKIDEGFARAVSAFAIARIVNGVISVVQHIQFSIPVVGGVSIAPGEFFAPLNDLIEKFSTLMLAVTVIFGLLKVTLAISSHWLISLLITVTCASLAYYVARRSPLPSRIASIAILVIMVRFAIPVVLVGSDLIFQKFLAADYEKSSQAFSLGAKQLDAFDETPSATPEGNAGIGDRMKNWLSQAAANSSTAFQRMKDITGRLVDHVIALSVIFLMQTLVIPFAIFWALARLTKGFFGFMRD